MADALGRLGMFREAVRCLRYLEWEDLGSALALGLFIFGLLVYADWLGDTMLSR